MHVLLTEFWMQPEATTGTAEQGAPPAREPTSGAPGGGGEFQLLMIPLMLAVFYFLMIRPQQKKQRETDDMLKALKKGDLVRTSGGIRGEITDINESDVTLLIADKVKINVLRSHVASKAATDAKEKG